METAGSLYAIGSGVSAIAGSPASSLFADWICSWFHKKRLQRRVRGLINLKGNTTLCQKLTTSDTVYIDCDSLMQALQAPVSAEELTKHPAGLNPVDEMLARSVVKKHILNICSVYKGKLILVSKSLDLLRALPIKHENIYFSAFSKDMEENISLIYPNEKEHHESTVNKFRIMQELDREHIFVCDSLNDLYDKVAEKFGSKRQQL